MLPDEIAKIICYVDGGCKNNGSKKEDKPVSSFVSMKAYAFDKEENKVMLTHIGKDPCSATTNNQAEYMALNGAIQFCDAFKKINPNIKFIFYTDSEIAVNQIKGYATINNPKLLDLALKAKMGLTLLGSYELKWVARHHIVAELGH